jgi:hypothetical protein
VNRRFQTAGLLTTLIRATDQRSRNRWFMTDQRSRNRWFMTAEFTLSMVCGQ